MQSKEWSLNTKDRLILHGKKWLPEQEPKKIICLVHGHGEHIGRYEYFAEHFTRHGLAIYGIDLRGHGKSTGKRGHVPSYYAIYSDIEELIKKARLDYMDTEIILYGHSLGGNFAASYIIHNKTNEIKGLVLSGPWLRLAFQPSKAKIKQANIMRKIWPSFADHSNLDASGLSTDPTVVKDYQEDPLVHDQITAGLFSLAVAFGEDAIQKAGMINVPTLIMHGDNDPITSLAASQEFAERRSVTIKIWPGARHEPHNELNKDEVLAFVSDWIQETPE